MKSWDCFDTLVARRFYKPDSVFVEVGRRLGIDDFVSKRVAAERNSDNTYAGIYKNLPGIDPAIEMAVELEHCYPIIENINQVQDGDLIISDIYHDAAFVEKILRNCGLTKNVKFVVTPDGKSNGWIWPTLSGIECHTGDNQHSDIVMANKHGITAKLYTDCHFNPLEGSVANFDYELACLMRYVRLQCPYTDTHRKNIWLEQADLNIPVLALATLELPDREIAFSYRDAIYWKPIYEAMTNKLGTVLDASRKCYYNPSPEFTEYVHTTVSNKLIVDIQGSGKSPAAFFKGPHDIVYITGPSPNSMTGELGDAIERHNCSSLGSLADWDHSGPIRDACEHDLVIVETQATAVEASLAAIKNFSIKRNLQLMAELIKIMRNDYTDRVVQHIVIHK